jgi:hypothetical protein
MSLQNFTSLPSLKGFFLFLWESPTLMTWGSFLTRSLSAVVVLPLVLRSFSQEEITLWFMFAQVVSLQLLVDMGFTPTFARLIAFAKGGAKDLHAFSNLVNNQTNSEKTSNWALIDQIIEVMQKVYTRMTLISFGLLLTVGTYFVYIPIQKLQNQANQGWLAWGVIVFTSLFYLRANQYSACLQGLNQVATLRRWEVLIALGGILSSLSVLLLNGGLLGMIVASQVWVVIGIGVNHWLANKMLKKERELSNITIVFQKTESYSSIFPIIWQTAWRSGLGVLISFGTLRFASLYIGGAFAGASAAMFLLGLRIIEIINEFAQAPLYSKLPRLAKLYAEGNKAVLIGVAKQGMMRSHWIFVGTFVLASLMGDMALQLIGSKTQFPEIRLWFCFGIAYFFQRFGAMHLHFFSTTNQIVWHKVNAITGGLFLLVFFSMYQIDPLYSYPVAMLVSSLLFYSWYCAYRAYLAFDLRFWHFEKTVALPPLVILLLFGLSIFLFWN